jgi:hypothetical protein
VFAGLVLSPASDGDPNRKPPPPSADEEHEARDKIRRAT